MRLCGNTKRVSGAKQVLSKPSLSSRLSVRQWGKKERKKQASEQAGPRDPDISPPGLRLPRLSKGLEVRPQDRTQSASCKVRLAGDINKS